MTGQGVRFAVVGSFATLTQLALYAFLSDGLGAQLANVVSWLASTIVANAAHHRFTFKVDGSAAESDHVVALLTSLAGLGLSSLLLAVLSQPAGLAGTAVLVAVNATVGGLRFLVLRWWLVLRPTARAAALAAPLAAI